MGLWLLRCLLLPYITLQSMMNAKLRKQRFWPHHESSSLRWFQWYSQSLHRSCKSFSSKCQNLCWLSLAFIIDWRVVPDLWPLRQAKVENDRGNPFSPALLMAILLCNSLSPQNGLFSRRFNRKTRIEGSRAFLPKLPKKRMSYDVCLYWLKKWQFFVLETYSAELLSSFH